MISFNQRKNTFKYDFFKGHPVLWSKYAKKIPTKHFKTYLRHSGLYTCVTLVRFELLSWFHRSHMYRISTVFFFVSWLDFTCWHGFSFLFLDIGLNKHILFFYYYFYTWLCILYFTPFFPLNARLLFKLVLYRQIHRKCTFYQCAFCCL